MCVPHHTTWRDHRRSLLLKTPRNNNVQDKGQTIKTDLLFYLSQRTRAALQHALGRWKNRISTEVGIKGNWKGNMLPSGESALRKSQKQGLEKRELQKEKCQDRVCAVTPKACYSSGIVHGSVIKSIHHTGAAVLSVLAVCDQWLRRLCCCLVNRRRQIALGGWSVSQPRWRMLGAVC